MTSSAEIELENERSNDEEERTYLDEGENETLLTRALLSSKEKEDCSTRGKPRNILRSTCYSPIEFFRKKQRAVALLFLALLITSLYLYFGRSVPELHNLEDDKGEGYLVWNPKCHMVSKNATDPSIIQYIEKHNFESCSDGPLLSFIEKDVKGSFSLVIDQKVAKSYDKFVCCWSPITRPVPKEPLPKEWDTKIDRGECQDFENRVQLPPDLEVVMLTCRPKHISKGNLSGSDILYENIHPIWNPAKVQSRLITSKPFDQSNKARRKMSILVLGLDSVSNLNFQRSLPKTRRYLMDTGWINLQGYNKMGDNTFPNLMAILTGQNASTALAKCQPQQAYGFDNCPFLWYNFRNAGYVTAYAEDWIDISTFNYHKAGFVNPPTDYYLRPYMIAAEKFLKFKKKFDAKYCTGPELTIDRIYDSALNFAKTFLGSPYFGFFWTNTVSHQNVNGPSSMDDHFLEMFEKFAESGVTNDALMVFLSDHGMRWGGIRNTLVGWYAERLPFIYLKLPEWMKKNPRAFQSLSINGHRLTSPYDLYETFREVLIKAGGDAKASSGCPTCQSLLKPVPIERGCADVGVSSHWCTCTALEPGNTGDKIAKEAAEAFLQYVENIVKDYKSKDGKRLCAKLSITKIHRADKIINVNNPPNDPNHVEGYIFLLEVAPGGGKFEATIRVHRKGNYSISNEEISRTDSYEKNAKCLNEGIKMFCHCIS
ncbi:uncharacterized protein LOC107041690 [Diachasma alloeum]|uniref:uncharacterized protein LOC107041690 n=1 Tax=Diachasma alloeum TaxID=454923 RepID=UPI0007384810|nr:uncharacterized protein LOC107041690 [Diachasma alloeum]XP_015117832.1 uncharacterized protein LOC107041690 [Diachasma alloeum]XP_015117833.1 uncharacterized protein LOC107041690 [Diachasma alloeum]